MSPSDEQATTAHLLRAASAEYDDLPSDVADRLDRVIDQLPTADTLHRPAGSAADGWIERLRSRRVRYALISAAAAVLVTVGGVAAAVQYVSDTSGGDAALTHDVLSDESGARGDDGAAPEADDFGTEEDETEAPSTAEETAAVETFTTGTDYTAETDLLAALRGLGSQTADGDVPEALAELAAGGEAWHRCQDAIAQTYDSLVVAVDFARYESEPAVMALLVSDSGEHAVAVAAECAEGIVSELAFQR